MGTVTDFPVRPRRAPYPSQPTAPPAGELPATGGRRGEYALADVARPLGLLHFEPRAIIDKLRALARHEGMPLPRTPRVVKGAPIRGPRAIVKSSRWDAGRFDAWLEGRGPAPAAAPATPALREHLQGRARSVFG